MSAAVHLWLIVGVPVRPARPVAAPPPVLSARIVPGGDAPTPHEPARIAVSALAAETETSPPPATPPAPEPKAARPEPPAKPAPLAPDEGSGDAAGISLPFVADPTYYPAGQLDVFPSPLAPIKLDYPEQAARDNTGGRLLLLLLIDELGVVDDVAVVEAEPPGIFEEVARAVLRATRFSPARKDGRVVKSRVLIQVSYDPGAHEGSVRQR